ncbi:MAG TPA: hypothetical protein DDX91_03035 [Ruminococcaceae bacterium]|nr:hypothetical protein [Oscillospiraceae bacterium]
MKFEINETAYRFTYGEQHRLDKGGSKYSRFICEVYIFDPDTFLVCSKRSYSSKAMGSPLLYPFASGLDVQKAYIKFFKDKKLESEFSRLDDNAYWNTFWKRFDDGGQKLADYNKFEDFYRIKMIVDWCENNSIPYFVNKKDEFIRYTMEYGDLSII